MIQFHKPGSDHVASGLNCHDLESVFTDGFLTTKVITDGCGSTSSPEVGCALFHYLLMKDSGRGWVTTEDERMTQWVRYAINKVFSTMLEMSKCDDDFIFNFGLFTILLVIETEKSWMVFTSGDGYIIALSNYNEIEFTELDSGIAYPKYWGYNWIRDKTRLLDYRDGVELQVRKFSKSDYCNVGVASDGIRFILNLPEHDIERQKFIQFLKDDKCGKIKMLINRNQALCKDDISIVF